MDESRIVLIKGNNSQWYEQVIFVLKHANTAAQKDLVSEAEKIINQYMASGQHKYKKNIAEQTAGLQLSAPPKASPPAASNVSAKSAPRRRYDLVAFFIDISLVAVSIYLGFVLNQIIIP